MNGKRVILITGVADYWGELVARRLIEQAEEQENSDLRLLGLDAHPLAEEIKGLDFIQADVRNPLMAELLEAEEVDTVVHLDFVYEVRRSESNFDRNVIGTMKLLGACAEVGVRKVILKSSMMVYGAKPENPSFLTEEHPVQGIRTYGYLRDLVEVESFCSGFCLQVSDIVMTILRFPGIVGTRADTPLTRFLKDPLAPMLLGYNPMMQVIHEEDVVGAILYVIENDLPGATNIAALEALPLHKLTALADKVSIPIFHPLVYLSAGISSGIAIKKGNDFPVPPDYLRYTWVGDLTRMRQEMKFEPRYTAEEALREFAGAQRLNRHMPEAAALAFDEERLRDTLMRRKRDRMRAAGNQES